MVTPIDRSFLSSFKVNAIDNAESIEVLSHDQRIQKIACSQIGVLVPTTTNPTPLRIPLSIPSEDFRTLGELLWGDPRDFQLRFPTSEQQQKATSIMLDIIKANEERRLYGKPPLSVSKEEVQDDVLKIAEEVPLITMRPTSQDEETILQAGTALQGRLHEIYTSAVTLWNTSRKRLLFPGEKEKTLDAFLTEQIAQNSQSIPNEEILSLLQFAEHTLHKFIGQTKFDFIHLIQHSFGEKNPSTEIALRVRSLFNEYLLATALEIGLTPLGPLEIHPETVETNLLLLKLVESNRYELLANERGTAPYLQNFVKIYNDAVKEALIQNIQKLGLKLPNKPTEQAIRSFITNRDEFLTHIAIRNCYASIPENAQVLLKFPKVRILADLYERNALPLRDAWVFQPAFATLQKIEKITKRRLRVCLPIRDQKEIGLGSTKQAIRVHLLKPETPTLGLPLDLDRILERQKAKVIVKSNQPKYQNNLLEECIQSQEFRKLGVRHTIVMRKIDVLNPEGDIIAVGAITELCSQGHLAHFLRRNFLSWTEKIKLAKELCQSLADIHKEGYCHNDLKAENIFITLDSDGAPTIRLGDFGNSRKINTLTAFPCSFISPEQFETALKHQLIPSAPSSDAYMLGNIIALIQSGENTLKKENLDFDTMIKMNFITDTSPPSADRARAYQILIRYRGIFERWQNRVRLSLHPEEVFTPLITHLFDPNPETRWTAQQALNFIESLPIT